MRRWVAAVVGTAALLAGVTWASPAQAQDDPGEVTAPVVLSVTPMADPDGADQPAERDAKANAQERIALELTYALGKGKSKDVEGFMESLYQGKWYMPKKEAVRKCIVDRESNFHYKAVSRGGIYRGAYQMNRALAIGVSWMMQKEVRKEMGAEGLKSVRALRSTKTQLWNRYWQDRAFWTIWRKGKGSRHWGVGATMCIKKAKRAQARQEAREQANADQDAAADQDGKAEDDN